jgi:uncharacterized Rossmann fold enzyme
MEWAVWRPLYLQILADFDYDIRADVESAKLLSALVDNKRIPKCRTIVEMLGQHVSIVGAAASMEGAVGKLSEEETIISAGSATSRLMKMGIVPDILVTDLDGDVDSEIEAMKKGSLAFIHAHGDNMTRIEEVIPLLTIPFVPTIQCKPFGNVYNFGGFTDGDRAVLIALHFGVKHIKTIGWDLDHPYPKEGCDPITKSRKLHWARRILLPYIDKI